MINLVFIHGAWASGWAWESLLHYFDSSVTRCHAVNLPGSESYEASLHSQAGIKEYTSHILDVISNMDHSVWLIAHSGGGLTATAVAEQNPDKIAGIIYVAGMMLPSGMSFTELCKTVSKRGIDTQGIAPYLQNTPHGTKVQAEGIVDIFLHDTTEDVIDLANKKMVIQPNASRIVTLDWTTERAGRVSKYYIMAERDRSVVPEVQREMITLVPLNGVASLNCGHFPQIVVPEQLAKMIMEFINRQSP
jgi:pimeloyl-ACP methyl ester carboxylesterase|tara:strand:- start:327 stop:1070 length:744 start_codon:yes stop_codon:yes gene_type:complete